METNIFDNSEIKSLRVKNITVSNKSGFRSVEVLNCF